MWRKVLAVWWSWLRMVQAILYHKLILAVAGWRVNARLPPNHRVSWWRLLVHDLSKFHPLEFFAYARHFFGVNAGLGRGDDPEFEQAFAHHVAHNDHHPEHWAKADGAAGRMTYAALVEMVADLHAATRSYGGSWPQPGRWAWVQANWSRMKVHEADKALLSALLVVLGFADDIPVFDWDTTRQTIIALGQGDDLTKFNELKRLHKHNSSIKKTN